MSEITEGAPQRVWGTAGIEPPLGADPCLLSQERALAVERDLVRSIRIEGVDVLKQDRLPVGPEVRGRCRDGLFHH